MRGRSAEHRARAVAMYLAGATALEVGAEIGSHPDSVARWVRAAGHEMRPAHRRPRPPPSD